MRASSFGGLKKLSLVDSSNIENFRLKDQQQSDSESNSQSDLNENLNAAEFEEKKMIEKI